MDVDKAIETFRDWLAQKDVSGYQLEKAIKSALPELEKNRNNINPTFISSSVKKVLYRRGEYITNHPINIMLCKSIHKGKHAWYPDNIGLPSIEFIGCDEKWVYENEKDRDAEFEKLAPSSFK